MYSQWKLIPNVAEEGVMKTSVQTDVDYWSTTGRCRPVENVRRQPVEKLSQVDVNQENVRMVDVDQ